MGAPTSGNAFARRVLEKIMPIPEKSYVYCADTYLVYRAPFFGDVGSIDELLGAYRVHGENGWFFAGLPPSRMRARKVLEGQMQKWSLVADEAARRGFTVPHETALTAYYWFQIRILSLKFGPKSHPVAGERLSNLVLRGICLALVEVGLSPVRRMFRVAKLLALGVLPGGMHDLFLALLNRLLEARPKTTECRDS